MVLAEQTNRTSQPKRSTTSAASNESNLTKEIGCLKNQLTEILAIKSHHQQQSPGYQPNYQLPGYLPNYQQPNPVADYQGRPSYP